MSYFGQLAYVLAHPNDLSGPVFFASVPTPAYWPMLVVATMASVIGAQSLISATFSLISQAIGLEAFPPVALHHTSASIQGQVYAPTGNWLLMATSIGLILFFQSSGALASAFGIAVTGTMAITTLIFMAMVILRWRWSALVVVPIGAAFFLVEMVYFSANMVKFNDGGWVALLLAAVAIIFMGSWKLGRVDVHRTLAAKSNRKTMRDVVGT
jgi:KUP system potassium uptake protein